MKSVLVVLAVLGAVVAEHRAAHAIVACTNNTGYAPRAGLTLSRRPHVLFFDDAQQGGPAPVFFARIAGKSVTVRATEVAAAPYVLWDLEIQSKRTGELEVGRVLNRQKVVDATYRIAAQAAAPTTVTATAAPFDASIRHTSVREVYRGLAIRLPDDTPAISAHVKLRPDAAATWFELDVPVVAGDVADKATHIALGELGCRRNYAVDLLDKGVDIEVAIRMADGSVVTPDLPAHVKR